MVTLILYSTLGCHLCDDAKLVMSNVLSEPAFEGLDVVVETVDIADDVSLLARYGEIIPVIKLAEEGENSSELQWPFDEHTFIQWWIKSL